MIPGTPGFFGERLREAREARGLTALQLAEIVGVTKQAISMYEKSRCSPSQDVLERLAQVMRVPVRHFLRPPPPQPSGALFWRSRNAATKRARTRAKRKKDWVREILKGLVDYIDLPSVDIPDISPPADPSRIGDALVEDAAALLRQRWGLGESIIGNVTLLLESKGIVGTRFELESEALDSFSLWDDYTGHPLLILGADKQSAARWRLDAAHELGHLVLHRNVPEQLLNHTPILKLTEDQAHHFARAFLLPARAFSRDFVLPTLNAIKSLKPKWKVSIGLMIKRAEELNLISPEQATRLWINRSRQGWNRREPFDDEMEPEMPVLLARSMRLLIESGILKKEDVSDTIGLYPGDIEVLTCLPPGYLEQRPVTEEAEPEPRLLRFPTEKMG